MKTTMTMTWLAVASLLGPTMAIAADSDTDRPHPEEFVKDSVITTSIKAQLAAQHITSLGRVSVDTDRNGIVWLSGTAGTQHAIDQAVLIARETDGVKTVHSSLTVKLDD